MMSYDVMMLMLSFQYDQDQDLDYLFLDGKLRKVGMRMLIVDDHSHQRNYEDVNNKEMKKKSYLEENDNSKKKNIHGNRV